MSTSTVTLDYQGVDILLRGETRLERELRAFSVRKEPETVGFIEAMTPTDILYDVGANVGMYSLIADKLGVTVYAFEPAPANYHHLCENITLNHAKVVPLPCALGHVNGLARFALSSTEAGAANHVVGNTGMPLGVWALDDLRESLMLPQPSHLKIDVDGGEVDVLLGATKTLRGVQSILVETNPETAQDVDNLLTATGFGVAERYLHARSGVTNSVWGKE